MFKKIMLIILSVILLFSLGVGSYFVINDLVGYANSSPNHSMTEEPEQPIEPEEPEDPVEEPDEPTDPEEPDEPTEPAVAWSEMIGAVVDGYSADLEPEVYGSFQSNSMSYVILQDKVLVTPSYYDESSDLLIYYATVNNEFCLELQILSYEDGVLMVDSAAILGDNLTFALDESGQMLMLGEPASLFCSNLEPFVEA